MEQLEQSFMLRSCTTSLMQTHFKKVKISVINLMKISEKGSFVKQTADE